MLAAEYDGVDLDGNTYSCTAFSYDTGKYYQVEVEFSGSDVTVTFANEHLIELSMDDDEIDNPHSISAFDYINGVNWDLDVDGLD